MSIYEYVSEKEIRKRQSEAEGGAKTSLKHLRVVKTAGTDRFGTRSVQGHPLV